MAACVAVRAQDPGLSHNKVFERVASMLNEGIPKDKLKARGIQRDHVRRAEKNYREAVGRAANTRPDMRNLYLSNQMRLLTLRFTPLTRIYDQAKTHPALRGLSGLALADAINAKFDILRVFDRAGEKVMADMRVKVPRQAPSLRATRGNSLRA